MSAFPMCLSRACFGKTIIVHDKIAQKSGVFLPVAARSEGALHLVRLRKRLSFVTFSYARPEPVLAKYSVSGIERRRKRRFRACSFLSMGSTNGSRCASPCKKTVFWVSFLCVCPEPVLVN